MATSNFKTVFLLWEYPPNRFGPSVASLSSIWEDQGDALAAAAHLRKTLPDSTWVVYDRLLQKKRSKVQS